MKMCAIMRCVFGAQLFLGNGEKALRADLHLR